jgi:hypothetical protein
VVVVVDDLSQVRSGGDWLGIKSPSCSASLFKYSQPIGYLIHGSQSEESALKWNIDSRP